MARQRFLALCHRPGVLGHQWVPAGSPEDGPGGVILPEEPVQKGTAWHQRSDQRTEEEIPAADSTLTYEGPVRRGGKVLQRVAVTSRLSMATPPGGASGLVLEKQQCRGALYFDDRAGCLAESRMAAEVDVVGFGDGEKIAYKIREERTLRRVDGK